MDDAERVTRDLRMENLNPEHYDIAGIVADLRASARRAGEIDTAPGEAWTNALIRRRRVLADDEIVRIIATKDRNLLDRLADS